MVNFFNPQVLPADDAALATGFGAIAVVLVVYLLLFVYLVFDYIMTALSLYTIANRRGIANPWLAWLPIGNNWCLGAITREYDERNGIKRRWDKVLLILNIITIALAIIFFIVFIVFVVYISISESNGTDSVEAMPMFALFLILFLISYIALICCSVATSFISIICIYKVFESTVPEKSLKYFLLSILCPFAAPICLFLCRNKGYELAPVYALPLSQIEPNDEHPTE